MIYGTLTKSDVFPKDEFNGLLPPKGQPENTISSFGLYADLQTKGFRLHSQHWKKEQLNEPLQFS